MFLPLHDDNPLKNIKFQYITVGFIVVCILVLALRSVKLVAIAAFGF